jgi:hypothetical protein
MAIFAPPPGELTPAAQGGERSFEEMLERVPVELVLAEETAGSVSDDVDSVEQDFWTDPCHFLRSACQAADYGAGTPSRPPDAAGAARR